MHRKALHLLYLLPVLLLSFQTSHAGRICWDLSHEPLENYNPQGEYRLLSERLEQEGFIVQNGEDEIDYLSLWDSDILVISILSNHGQAYNSEEVDRIESFVAGGGGLVIMADNTHENPENLETLLERFGMAAALNDSLEDLEAFEDIPLFQDVNRIVFLEAGTVGLTDEDAGRIVAIDRSGRAGIVVNEQRHGYVILLGDADFWTNDVLNEADNLQLALNCFAQTDREASGRITIEDSGTEYYLPQGSSFNHRMTVANTGEGALEIGCIFVDNPNWISCHPTHAVIEPEDSLDLVIEFATDELDVSDDVTATMIVNHNDPETDPLEIDYRLHVISPQPVYFDVPDPSGSDHSLLVRQVSIDGEPAPPGFELAVFTPGDICGGGAVSSGGQIGVTAIADDQITEEIDGFRNGEAFTFRLYLPWSETETGAVATYERGEGNFRSGGSSVLSLAARPYGTLRISLNRLWNQISLNVHPPDLDMAAIFAPLLEDNLIIRIKDGRGRFWDIPRGYNNLRDWDITYGYKIRVAQFTSFEVSGAEADPETPIQLPVGWNLIPYLPQESITLEDGFASIMDHLEIVKRDDGAFFLSRWNWDGIGILDPGEGYWIRLNHSATLTYPGEIVDLQPSGRTPRMFTPSVSGLDMSLYLEGLPPQTWVRIIAADGSVVGSGKADNCGRIGLPVWGDDPVTDEVEGLRENDDFHVENSCLPPLLSRGGVRGGDLGHYLPSLYLSRQQEISTCNRWLEIDIDWIQGGNRYSEDRLSIGTVNLDHQQPAAFDLHVHPNPFNNWLWVRYNSPVAGETSVTIYDLSGRLIEHHILNRLNAPATGEITLNGEDWPAGVLLFRLTSGCEEKTVKVVHLP